MKNEKLKAYLSVSGLFFLVLFGLVAGGQCACYQLKIMNIRDMRDYNYALALVNKARKQKIKEGSFEDERGRLQVDGSEYAVKLKNGKRLRFKK